MFVVNDTLLALGAFTPSLLAELVPVAVQELWKNAIESGLMGALGVTVAVFGVGFWGVEFYREVQKGVLIPAINRSIYPVVLAVLLFSSGVSLMTATDVVNAFVDQTICNALLDVDDVSCLNGIRISADGSVEAESFGVRNGAESLTNQDRLDFIVSTIMMGLKDGFVYGMNAMVPICLVLLAVSLFIGGGYKDKG